MALTVNIYYKGEKGNARKFANEIYAGNPLHNKRKSLEELVKFI